MHIQEMNAFLPFGNQTSKFEIPPFIVDFPSKKTPINYRIFLIATFDYQRETTFNTWAVFKIPLSFHYTGWFIGIPLLDYDS